MAYQSKNESYLETSIKHLKSLCGEDEELFHDMVEGETDLDEFITKTVLQINDDVDRAASIGNRVKDMQGRKKRFEDRAKNMRTVIAKFMEMAEHKKLELDIATISLSIRKPGALVTDEAEIPAKYWIPSDPKLDKKAINDDFKEGKKIPGVTADNGSMTVVIRSK